MTKDSSFGTFRAPMYSYAPAEVAELVDAPASGAGELMLVEVQVLFSAPGAWLLTRFSLHGLQTPSRMVCQSGPIPGQRLLDYGQITTVLRTAPGLR